MSSPVWKVPSALNWCQTPRPSWMDILYLSAPFSTTWVPAVALIPNFSNVLTENLHIIIKLFTCLFTFYFRETVWFLEEITTFGLTTPPRFRAGKRASCWNNGDGQKDFEFAKNELLSAQRAQWVQALYLPLQELILLGFMWKNCKIAHH